jgi:hypothetical protein
MTMKQNKVIRDIPGFYRPVKAGWEVVDEDGWHTISDQTLAIILSNLIQIRQQLKRLGVKSDLDIFNDEEDRKEASL